MKRFYKLVTLQDTPGGYAIHLDGRPVKTPMGKTLMATNHDLASALQSEWAAQEQNINPETMPLTQILSTQIDQVSTARQAMSAEVLKYLDTDLICYRAGPMPPGTQEAQIEAWDPWLSWFEKNFEETLQTTTGLSALSQPKSAHNKIKGAVDALDDAHFTILQIIVPLSGSLVLGLAFINRAISPEELYKAIRVEENIKAEIYNEELYGQDPAQERKEKAIKADIAAAAHYLELIA